MRKNSSKESDSDFLKRINVTLLKLNGLSTDIIKQKDINRLWLERHYGLGRIVRAYAYDFPLSYYEDSKRFPQQKEIYQIRNLVRHGKITHMFPYMPETFLNYIFKTCDKLEELNWRLEESAYYIHRLPLEAMAIADFGTAMNLIMVTYISFTELDPIKRDAVQKAIEGTLLAKASKINPALRDYGIDLRRVWKKADEEEIRKESINPEFNKFVKQLDVKPQVNSEFQERTTASFLGHKTAYISVPSPLQETQRAMVQPKIEVNFEIENVNISWDLSAFKKLTKEDFALYCAYMIIAGLMPNFVFELHGIKRLQYVGALLVRAGFGIDQKTPQGDYRSPKKMVDEAHPFVKHQHKRLEKHEVLVKILDLLEPEAKAIATKELKLARKEYEKKES